jgi:tellurium resistance protein TerD
MGDNTTGNGEGDDEQLVIDLLKVPNDVTRIAVTITIHDAKNRRQNFGVVANSFVRVLEFDSQKELLRYDLEEDFSIVTAIIVCEIFNHNGLWKFSAIGNGLIGGLENLCGKYGVSIKDAMGVERLVKK